MRFDHADADAWFHRNAAALTPEHPDYIAPVLERLGLLQDHGLHVMEVGAANGWRLAALAARYPTNRYTAVELSAEAAAAGAAQFGAVSFLTGAAHQVPAGPASVDVLILSFVLHWVARAELLAVAAETDRLLKPGGHLVIADFWPERPTKTPYHHHPGLWTYKLDHRQVWLAGAGYEEVVTEPFSYVGTIERCMTGVLRKGGEEGQLYRTVERRR